MSASIYEEITNGIIKSLESGVAPWVKPWSTMPGEGIPVNAHTNRPYSGVNVLQLWYAALDKSYDIPQWLTFKQAKERGGQVRKGEHGTKVLFWKINDKEVDGKTEKRFIARSYTVFNVAQVDGIEIVRPKVERYEWESRKYITDLVTSHGIDLRHGGSSAFFRPDADYIGMPEKDRFPDVGSYYATLLHEMTHWTGHKSRLDRKMRGTFGSPDYAKEELVAELGAAFLCARLGIDGQLQHDSYIKSWLQVLKDDKRAVFVASKLAEQAADYIMEKSKEEKGDDTQRMVAA